MFNTDQGVDNRQHLWAASRRYGGRCKMEVYCNSVKPAHPAKCMTGGGVTVKQSRCRLQALHCSSNDGKTDGGGGSKQGLV